MQPIDQTTDYVPPEQVMEFFKQRQYKVIQTTSCWWYNEHRQNWLFYSFPLHRLIQPTREELSTIFRQAPGARVLRFISPSDCPDHTSFMWTARAPYDLSRLSANTRSKTRRGMKNCQVRPLSWDELIAHGEEAQRDTLVRRGARHAETIPLDVDQSFQNCSAYEAWGAYVDEQLAAYLVILRAEDWAYLLINRSANAFLKLYPNNALVYTAVHDLLSRPGISAVSYGWEPLTPLESLEQFKLSMGFEKTPVRQRVVLHPLISRFFQPFMARLIEQIAMRRPNNQRLQKLAGLCMLLRASQ
jgi:hypothetical protein